MNINFNYQKLENYILIKRGKNYTELHNKGIQIIKTKQIKKESIYNENSNIYTSIFYKNDLIKKNEIVMSVTGEGRGKINLIKNSKILIDSTLINIKSFNKKIINEIYLFYLLKSKMELLKEKAEGSSIKNIKSSYLKNIKIPLIDINKQKLIGDFFTKIDQLIEINKQKNNLILDLKKYKMNEIFNSMNINFNYQKLEEILNYSQPTNFLVKKITNEGDIPILTANKSFVLGYTKNSENVFKNLPCLIFDDFTCDIKYVNFPFKLKSSAIKILTLKNKNHNLKYIFEKLKLIKEENFEHKRHWISQYQNKSIKLIDIDKQNLIGAFIQKIDHSIDKNKTLINFIQEYKNYYLNEIFK